MMVLIVDDNAAVRGLIRQVLKGFADEVHECADGALALAICQTKRPDVVLMDIEMPGMDGLTATRHLTAASPAARVVIVSQHDEEPMRAASFAAGAGAFASKEELAALPAVLRGLMTPPALTSLAPPEQGDVA